MPKRKPKDPERSPDLPHDWIQRQLNRLARHVVQDPIELTTWEYRRARLVGAGRYEYLDDDWGTIAIGEFWGGAETTAFFRKRLTIPDSHANSDSYLDIDLDGGETQLTIDGRPWQGLDYYRSLVPLAEFALAGREIELGMEAFVINYPYDERRHDERDLHRFLRARLVKVDKRLEAFLVDARFVLGAYLDYWRSDEDQEIEAYLRHHLEEACRLLVPEFRTREELHDSLEKAYRVLQENCFNVNAYRRPGTISVCAHSHLDIVYLWPIKETLRKNCRTITNALSLMREFPAYCFSYSQPYLYEKLKEMFPAVYEEVKQRVQEGRWEVIGAMYLEPDGNLLGAESLVRQLLFGKRFIRKEFGIESETCWLPDVFGAMYTLPQVLQKAGVRYFTTAKLNIWNDTNEFPYDTFRWRGPDGSEVIAHFPPSHFAQSYTFERLHRHWESFREKQITGENLFIYGWGDGGGGPTREMVGASVRSRHFLDLPATEIEFAEEFFRRQHDKRDKLPVWDGELYLEAHRGTYTSKAELKRQNRKVELLYRDAEILSSFATLYGGARVQEELNQGWKLVLLNQFHDTLPGTHKPAAMPDIIDTYQRAFCIGQDIRDKAIGFLVQQMGQDTNLANDLVIFNTLSWERRALVSTELNKSANCVQTDGGSIHPVQHHGGSTWFTVSSLPSMGWTAARFDYQDWQEQRPVARFDKGIVETPLYRVELAEDGSLAHIFDKNNGRAVLSAPGNVFQVFEDDPGFKFSAWDIAYHFEEYQYPVQQITPWRLQANGPLFAVLTSAWQVLDSTIEQEMWLYAGHPRIDFHTRVNWRDSQKLLKVAFPLKVRSLSATYDLPFGNIERPTHRNTSWEQAKFEVCGHKWADVSEANYGVGLLNDCKYGYDVRENILRLSLLRSPIRPDGQSDIGLHKFTYALLPHAGNWREAQVDRSAYELNVPALAVKTVADGNSVPARLAASQSILTLESNSLIVETIKQAEEGDDLILRTFDSHGGHVESLFSFGLKLNRVAATNLLEEEPEPVGLNSDRTFSACYSPFEIKTHRLQFDTQDSPSGS